MVLTVAIGNESSTVEKIWRQRSPTGISLGLRTVTNQLTRISQQATITAWWWSRALACISLLWVCPSCQTTHHSSQMSVNSIHWVAGSPIVGEEVGFATGNQSRSDVWQRCNRSRKLLTTRRRSTTRLRHLFYFRYPPHKVKLLQMKPAATASILEFDFLPTLPSLPPANETNSIRFTGFLVALRRAWMTINY